MRVEYDGSVDAAYIYLKEIGRGESAYQHVVDEHEGGGTIVLDFDKEGRLLGVEVLGARATLPDEVLATAKRIG